MPNELREAGYTTDGCLEGFAAGHIQRRTAEHHGAARGRSRITRQDTATIHMSDGEVESITDEHGQPLASYELEPLLITGLSEAQSHQSAA